MNTLLFGFRADGSVRGCNSRRDCLASAPVYGATRHKKRYGSDCQLTTRSPSEGRDGGAGTSSMPRLKHSSIERSHPGGEQFDGDDALPLRNVAELVSFGLFQEAFKLFQLVEFCAGHCFWPQ